MQPARLLPVGDGSLEARLLTLANENAKWTVGGHALCEIEKKLGSAGIEGFTQWATHPSIGILAQDFSIKPLPPEFGAVFEAEAAELNEAARKASGKPVSKVRFLAGTTVFFGGGVELIRWGAGGQLGWDDLLQYAVAGGIIGLAIGYCLWQVTEDGQQKHEPRQITAQDIAIEAAQALEALQLKKDVAARGR